jgi:hypothetical protein
MKEVIAERKVYEHSFNNYNNLPPLKIATGQKIFELPLSFFPFFW